MPAANNRGLHTVELNEDYLKKLKKHRRRIRLAILLVVALVLAGAFALKLYFDGKEYTDYELISVTDRQAGAVSQYMHFAGGILRYNYDGATFTSGAGDLMWNQTYELENPRAAVSDAYAAVYEFGGKEIFLMSTEKSCAAITTTVPIRRVSVSDAGLVAVLMEEDGVSHISLYDESGVERAGGELYSKNAGYPLDIALSGDGKLLGVSILNINEAKLTTNLVFYNFGTVGRSEVDNIVASYSYDGLFVPRVSYMKGDYMAAFATDRTLIFSGAQKPEEYASYPIVGAPKQLFMNSAYYGIAYDDKIEVYTPSAGKVFEYEDDFDDCTIDLLDNGEISAIKGNRVCIYNQRGIKRYEGEPEDGVLLVIPKLATHYLFVAADKTMEVRLK